MAARMTAGKGGEFYVPYENRKGCESIVSIITDFGHIIISSQIRNCE